MNDSIDLTRAESLISVIVKADKAAVLENMERNNIPPFTGDLPEAVVIQSLSRHNMYGNDIRPALRVQFDEQTTFTYPYGYWSRGGKIPLTGAVLMQAVELIKPASILDCVSGDNAACDYFANPGPIESIIVPDHVAPPVSAPNQVVDMPPAPVVPPVVAPAPAPVVPPVVAPAPAPVVSQLVAGIENRELLMLGLGVFVLLLVVASE